MLVAVSFFWSLSYPIVAAFRDDAPPVLISFLRWLSAFLMFAPFCWRAMREEWAGILAHRWRLFVLGAFSCGLNSAFAFIGIHHTSVTNAALLSSMTPILTILLALPMSKERLTPGRAAGVLIAFSGVVCIIVKGEFAALTAIRINGGDFFIIAASTVWAVFTNLLRRWSASLSQRALSGALMMYGLVSLAPLTLVEATVTGPVRWSWAFVLGMLVLGVFPSLLANTFWNKAVHVIGPGRAATFTYLLPLFSIVLALVVLGERIHGYHWAGAALIFSGIAVASRRW